MAALSITAANVVLSSGPASHGQLAGEAFNAGAMLYFKESDSKWYKAQGDGTAEEAGSVDVGMALSTAAAAGAFVSIAKADAVVTIGSVPTAGVVYTIDDTAGSIGPIADRGSADKVTVVALGVSATAIKLARVYHAGSVLA